jgi:transcription elongation factor GreA
MQKLSPITKEGFEKLNNELNHLIRVERESLKIVIAEARALGDLKENAEYHSAKEKQALIEGRISHLNGVIANSQVIDPKTIKSDRVVFGATVKLADENGNIVIYKIVGSDESDMKVGKISFTSPIGKALIGRESGDTIVVKAPKGDVTYEIESFSFE